MIYFIYILTLLATPFVADLMLVNFEPGGLLSWWGDYILFPLKEKNSKWANIAGACPNCFTTWMGTFLGTSIAGIYIYIHFSHWWLFSLPSFMFMSMGLTAMFYKLYVKIFKDGRE